MKVLKNKKINKIMEKEKRKKKSPWASGEDMRDEAGKNQSKLDQRLERLFHGTAGYLRHLYPLYVK